MKGKEGGRLRPCGDGRSGAQAGPGAGVNGAQARLLAGMIETQAAHPRVRWRGEGLWLLCAPQGRPEGQAPPDLYMG